MAEEAGQTRTGFMIDLDGTLYHGNQMIDGADHFIRSLRERDIPYLFVTNNSTAAPEVVADRLARMGIPAQAADVCTSAQAAGAYAASQYPGGRAFIIGETGLHEAVAAAGLAIVADKPDVVIQGLDRSLTYERLADAIRYIREGAAYILTNPDVLLPSEGGFLPGAGSIAAMLERATGVKPVVIGKPSEILMKFALDRLDMTAADAWVIGDNPFTDIAAGQAAGCRSVLVLTGLATKSNYEELLAQAGCSANEIIPDLHALLEWIHRVELHQNATT
ncbi:4-nitrophenyl phosphatase [Paenibacillus phyllosphaerae]|uniref:Acid sugar phosphatase n=1 Tax=Paenibacillus phyllosphaerae TaxID=274593 RepID=A0A7W5FMT6_9BACL|nr:TIGR01457 family HAD-type hydrolase [Paenibacillus phyllosphaerae]MBB3110354.1 4-nitrophenyl phosphatase [Paenibacillus phyllosphaerae]